MNETSRTILVVDDRPATRYATARVIKNAGFNVLEAATGSEALQLVQSSCDLIVLDINLPDINGHEVCRRIRQQLHLIRVPVIHLSASFISDEHKIRGLEAGADGYLTHPVDPLVLIATIKAFLRTHEVESALIRSEAKFRAIFDRALTGICLLSKDMIFLDVNPAFCKMLDMARESLVGKHGSAFVRVEQEQFLLEISNTLENSGIWHGSLSFLRANGHFAELDWNISLHSEPGVRLAMVADVTEKHQIEMEREQLLESERAARLTAEHANRLKDEFLATLSHELRTPLNAIVGWTQLLKFRRPNEQDLAKGLEVIERNAKAQAELINDLLDVSRIMSGKLHLELELIDPGQVLRESIAGVLPTAHAKGVQIEMDLTAEYSSIRGDRTRLQQILWNLVNNAVKFTPPGGQVDVKLVQSPEYIHIHIRDSGQGIKPEFLPHLFERFRQEDASTTRSHGGLGLGLAIVKNLVELHGGTVTAHSEGEGSGAEFIVQIPCSGDPQHKERVGATPTISADSEQSPVTQLQNVRVLIVDDDYDARGVAIRVLREYRADVRDASSVEEAVRILDEFHPHILVSDIGMPNQDGYDLIRAIRRKGLDARQLPAIALTAFARNEDRHRVLFEGYQIHLGKPIAPTELLSAILRLVQPNP